MRTLALLLFLSCNSQAAPVVLIPPSPTAIVVHNPAPPEPGEAFWVPVIRFEGTIDEKAAQALVKVLEAVPEATIPSDGGVRHPDAIVLELNTTGGSVPDGFEIARAIEDAPVQVICLVDGPQGAQSMGFYILQSCDIRLMTKRSVLMVHQPHYGRPVFRGSAVEWQNIASWLKALNRGMVEHEVKKMNVSAKQLEERILGASEWYMDWEQALNVRAVDGVVSSSNMTIKTLRRLQALPPDTIVPAP